MSLDQDDILRIQMVVKEEVKHVGNKVFSLNEEVRQMRQTIYGVEGENGLQRTVKDLSGRMNSIEKFKTQVVTVFSTVQIAVVSYFKFYNK